MKRRPTLTNDEQLWLMNQVKMSSMTVNEAVSWTEARTNELRIEEEANNNNKDPAGRKTFRPAHLLKTLLPKKGGRKIATGDATNSSVVRKNVERSSVSSEEQIETSGGQDLRSKQVYNFSIYKCSKHKVPQKRIMQIDFGVKVISLIHHGNILTNHPFSSLVNVDGQEGKKVFIYFDDSQELELNAENLADKTKLIRLLNVISEQNDCEERGQPFDPCEKLQLSFRVIKEGYLEKKGAYSAINWNRRLVVIRSGELAYYRVEEEEQTAALIINLSPGSIAINPEDSNTFTIATTKESYRFRIPENPAASLPSSQETIRDEWISAIHEGCKRSYYETSDSGEDGEDGFDLIFQELNKIKQSLSSEGNKSPENVQSLQKLEELCENKTSRKRNPSKAKTPLTNGHTEGHLGSNGGDNVGSNEGQIKSGSDEPDTLLEALLSQNGVNGHNEKNELKEENPYTLIEDNPEVNKRESKISEAGTPNRGSSIGTPSVLSLPTTPATSRPGSKLFTPSPQHVPTAGMPPPPPPAAPLPPPPPGLPPPPGMSPKESKCKYSMRPFHWSAVPKQMIAKSMWKNMEDLRFLVDQEELNELFQVTNDKKQNETPIKAPAEKIKKRATESFLDRKTAQNLGIFLAGFKLRGDEMMRRVNIISEDEGGISTEHLIGLYKFCPEPELKTLYEKEMDRKEEFSKEDRFMMELCQIPRLNVRLEIATITRELPQEIEDLQPAVDHALDSLNEVMNSKYLERLLAYILAVANQINCSNSKGTVKGIRLSSLQKTCVMRTNDRKQTLLQVVLRIVEKNEAELLQLPEELKSVSKSHAYSTKGLLAEIDILRKNTFKVRKNCDLLRRKKNQPTPEDLTFCTAVETRLTEIENNIKQLSEKCSEIKKSLSKILLKFGETPETDSQDLFSWLRDFITNFTKSLP
ncbi:uncharacterized protein LOC100176399 isoform X1 [Ciona intestinalis]